MRGLTSYSTTRLVAALLLFFSIVLWHGEAWAINCVTRPSIPIKDLSGATTIMPTNPSGGPPGSAYSAGYPPTAYAEFTHPLVGCMEDMIVYFGMTGFTTFRNTIKDTVVGVLVLYLVIMGYKTLFNAFDKSYAAEFSIVVVKFTAVTFLVLYGGVEYFMPGFYTFMKGLTDVITSTVPGNPACGYDRIWVRIDCNLMHAMLGDVVGGSNNPWALLSIAGQLIWTPPGLAVMVMVGIMVFFMVAAFATACMAYVMCIIALTVLMMISPITIPTVLFNSTKTIFDVWFKALIGYTLMPMILFGYLAFCLQIYSYVIDPPGAGPNNIMGLRSIATDIVNTINNTNYKSHKTVVEGQSRVENRDVTTIVADPAQGKNSEVEGWSFVVTSHEYNAADVNICSTLAGDRAKYISCRTQHLLINLMVLAIMMVLTLSFMNNVMSRAGEMVGAGVSATFMSNINYYAAAVNAAKNLTKDATAAAVSGGADLSMKNSVSGAMQQAGKM
jgi:hypothetical protein